MALLLTGASRAESADLPPVRAIPLLNFQRGGK